MHDDSRDVPEAALFARASAGEGSALHRLVGQYLPRLHGYVRVHMGQELRRRESVADVVQSVCREIAERAELLDFPDEARFRSWLFKAALNKIHEKVRFHHRAKRDIARDAGGDGMETEVDVLSIAYASVYAPSRQAMAREELGRLESALAHLAEDQREVIALARIAGLPHDVVAERMDRSVGAVRQLLARALLKLQKALDPGDEA